MFGRFTVAALAAGAMTGMAAPSIAQQPGASERAQAESREQDRSRADLERARAELEAAAREVARLSAEFAAPAVREAMRIARHAQQRAMLGVGTEDDARGVRITAVSPSGPAATAGLEPGDVIVAIDGAALAGGGEQSPTAAMLAQMEHVQPGESVTLEVLRNGTGREVTVQARALGQRFWWPHDFDFSWPEGVPRPGFGFFGGPEQPWRSMELTQLTPELGAYFGVESGVLVVRGPNREGFGLRDGDVIVDIGGRAPTSPEHAMRILGSFEPGETLRITIMRRQRRETLEIEVPRPER